MATVKKESWRRIEVVSTGSSERERKSKNRWRGVEEVLCEEKGWREEGEL